MNIRVTIRRHPVATYFGLAFLISWGSGLILLGPKLVRSQPTRPMDALLLFPVLVIGVALVGITLTRFAEGKSGLRELFSRVRRWRVSAGWYAAALLIPPVLILLVLSVLRALVSAQFRPGCFLLGILFGLFPGFFEEIGWTGYAYPRMRSQRSALATGILLGVLWGVWHLPVVDSLGAAAPHGKYWLPFFLAFVALVTAMRVLIVWVYANTGSVLLAQLMHASSTGSLVVLGPSRLSSAQEALWYGVYAVLLWVVVFIVASIYGKALVR
jgi:membrane protease YdiL (CAAX protease family)